MKRALIPVALVLALTSPAWGQVSPRVAEPGAFAALWRHAGNMLADPIFLALAIVVLLIASRFLNWALVPLGGAAGALAIAISAALSGSYSTYDQGTTPFWGAAISLGIGLGMAVVIVLRMLGKRE